MSDKEQDGKVGEGAAKEKVASKVQEPSTSHDGTQSEGTMGDKGATGNKAPIMPLDADSGSARKSARAVKPTPR